MFWDSELNVAL